MKGELGDDNECRTCAECDAELKCVASNPRIGEEHSTAENAFGECHATYTMTTSTRTRPVVCVAAAGPAPDCISIVVSITPAGRDDRASLRIRDVFSFARVWLSLRPAEERSTSTHERRQSTTGCDSGH